MATLNASSIQANNLLSQIRELATENNQSIDALIHNALCLIFAFTICDDAHLREYAEDAFSERLVNISEFEKLRESLLRLSRSNPYEFRNEAANFFHCLKNFFQRGSTINSVAAEEVDSDTLHQLYHIVSYNDLSLRIEGVDRAQRYLIFDRLFYALNGDISPAAERFCSRLLNSLNFRRNALIAEIPLVTAETAIDIKAMGSILLNASPPYSLPLLMRTFLYRLDIHDQPVADLYFIRQAQPVAHRLGKPTDSMAIGALIKFAHWPQQQPFMALVGVDNRLRKDDWEQLLASDRLMAAVEIPATLKSRSKRLFILTNLQPQAHILFIDISLVAKARRLSEDIQAELVAAILIKCFGFEQQQEPHFEKETKQVLARFLPDRYHNINGLCKSVAREKVTHKNQLKPSAWIDSVKEQNVFDDRLDGEIIWSQLSSGRRRQCHYVIGSNGAGKSLMLSEFARRYLAEKNGTSVLLVAFGLTDRFHSLRKHDPERCFYLGDRHSEKTVSLSGRQRALGKNIYQVYNDAEKRDLAIKLLKTFDLSSDVYFLPHDFSIQNNELYSDKEIHNLDAIEAGQLVAFEEMASDSLLFRKVSSPDAVLFSDLSSGEQHILTMMFRILAAIKHESIVLIDEPELSLHVEWQQLLPKQFELIRMKFSVDMVIATHSPILIAAVDHKHSRCYLASAGSLREISESETQNLEATLLDAFGVVTANNRTVYEHCARIVADFMGTVNQSADNDLLAPKARAISALQALKHQIAANRVTVASYERDQQLLTQAERAIEELYHSRMTGGRE